MSRSIIRGWLDSHNDPPLLGVFMDESGVDEWSIDSLEGIARLNFPRAFQLWLEQAFITGLVVGLLYHQHTHDYSALQVALRCSNSGPALATTYVSLVNHLAEYARLPAIATSTTPDEELAAIVRDSFEALLA